MSQDKMRKAAGGIPEILTNEIDRSRLRELDAADLRRAVGGKPDVPDDVIDRSRLRELDDDDLRRAIGLFGQV